MEYIYNPFKKHTIDLCCSSDELRPFLQYIYFIDGIAYATDAFVMLSLSLFDIDADEPLIACLNGYKMHHSDMQMIREYTRLFPDGNGKIFLNVEHTRILQLHPLDYNDSEKKYLKILHLLNKAKSEVQTNADSVSKIKFGLSLLERLGKAVGFLNTARFNFLKNPTRVFLEFDNYKNSFAIVMPMMDDVSLK